MAKEMCTHLCVKCIYACTKYMQNQEEEEIRMHEAEAIECPSINVNNVLKCLENIECVQ